MQKNSCNFPVEFITAPFGESPDLARLLSGGRTLIVADMNVVQRVAGIGTQIGLYVKNQQLELAGSPVVVAGGEKCKADGLESVKRIIATALDVRIGHNDTILALGGGAVLDVAGYVAAQLRGGIRLLRMPTTPSAKMDATYSTTAAVDCGVIKDALRVPSVPSAVVIDPALAMPVLDGVWNAGISAVLRFAAVSDAALLKKLIKLLPDYHARKPEALAELVRLGGAARMKKGGTNFALWSASRMESMSDYRLPHGYAVAIGILIDSAYAVEQGMMKTEDRETLVKILSESGALDGLLHSRHLLEQTDSLLRGIDAHILAHGTDKLVFPVGLGKSEETTVDRAVMQKVIKSYFCNAATA